MPMLTVHDVAAELQVTERTVRRMLADGRLPFHKLGPTDKAPVRISQDDFAQYLEQTRAQAAMPTSPRKRRSSTPPPLAPSAAPLGRRKRVVHLVDIR